MQDPLQVRKNLARRIRDLRRRRGWSQERLALESGLGRGFTGAIERAEKVPGMATLLKLAGVFGITLSALMKGIDGPQRRSQGRAGKDESL
jgi:transcriptional regulator with XRE-family HTH domain